MARELSIIVPVYILYLTILFGGVGKVYLWLRCGVPLAQIAVTVPTHSVFFHSIGASGVLDADDSHFNVVLLGASTAGQLAAGLNEELIRIHGDRLRRRVSSLVPGTRSGSETNS